MQYRANIAFLCHLSKKIGPPGCGRPIIEGNKLLFLNLDGLLGNLEVYVEVVVACIVFDLTDDTAGSLVIFILECGLGVSVLPFCLGALLLGAAAEQTSLVEETVQAGILGI